MSTAGSTPVGEWLATFRSGKLSAAGPLLHHFEPWLKVLARMQWESRFGGKFDPADLVQQALLEAARDLEHFRGQTEAELAAWLRRILAHVLAHEIRRYRGTQKRDLEREVALDRQLTAASERLGDVLPSPATVPDEKLIRRERALDLARALERLPADYREVIVLRHLEGLSHEAIAERLGRNAGAVRMLWVRALARLRKELPEET